MSRKLVSLIQDNPRLSAKHKRTLECYAARANNDGTNVFASKETLGKKASVSRSTIYHNTPDLIRVGILVQAKSHTCKVPSCNKGGTHYWGVHGKYTVVYNIDLAALENDETYLLLNQLKVPLPKQLNLFVQKRIKDGVEKLDATQSLRTTPVSLSEKIDSSVLADGDSKRESEIGIPPSADCSPEKQEQRQSDDCGAEAESKAKPDYSDLSLWTDEEQRMLFALLPTCIPSMFHLYNVRTILTFCTGEGVQVDPYDLLRWNRAHKAGALYIRTPDQFLKALIGKDGEYKLVNDYKTHSFSQCKVCQAHKVTGPRDQPSPETTRYCNSCGSFNYEGDVYPGINNGFYCIDCIQTKPYIKDAVQAAARSASAGGFQPEEAE